MVVLGRSHEVQRRIIDKAQAELDRAQDWLDT
jgi:hypothetical protein